MGGNWNHNTQLQWNTGVSQNPGNTNLNLILFNTPIVTSELHLEQMTYTANPVSGQSQANPTDGHTISFEVELFGCSNYNIEQSKLFILT